MPSYGEKQMPAGVDKSPMKMKGGGMMTMQSRNMAIKPSLRIDTDCEYKGNPVLNAQR